MNWNYTGKQLQQIRSAGLTQREVSDMLGLKDTANISDWENDRVDVPPKHRKRLLTIYGVSRQEPPQPVEDAVSFIKLLIPERAKTDKGKINYKLIKLANEGVDEVMDFLLNATPAEISELGHTCKIKAAEMNPSYTKLADED